MNKLITQADIDKLKLHDFPAGEDYIAKCDVVNMFKSLPPAEHAEALKLAREALEKLSKLGNGEMLGNSDGNIIAQQALAKLDEVLA